jgi:hypothetical protein
MLNTTPREYLAFFASNPKTSSQKFKLLSLHKAPPLNQNMFLQIHPFLNKIRIANHLP